MLKLQWKAKGLKESAGEMYALAKPRRGDLVVHVTTRSAGEQLPTPRYVLVAWTSSDEETYGSLWRNVTDIPDIALRLLRKGGDK